MADLLSKCEEYYGTRNFYEVLNIDKDASEKDSKLTVSSHMNASSHR